MGASAAVPRSVVVPVLQAATRAAAAPTNRALLTPARHTTGVGRAAPCSASGTWGTPIDRSPVGSRPTRGSRREAILRGVPPAESTREGRLDAALTCSGAPVAVGPSITGPEIAS